MSNPEKYRHTAQEITEFYRHIRGYWGRLSASQDGQNTSMLNFGFWKNGCTNLSLAQQHLLAKVIATLDRHYFDGNGLEIGCGIGGISIGLLKQMPALRMRAIDISAEQLALARQNAESAGVLSRMDFFEDNSMALSFDVGQFDFTLCIESSFHYDDMNAFFAENFRVLKPGGQAVLADITCEDTDRITFRRGNNFRNWQHYIKLAEETGFIVESSVDIGQMVYPQLYRYILKFNKTNKEFNGKYWSVVLRNYAYLANLGKMGYHFFSFRKPF